MDQLQGMEKHEKLEMAKELLRKFQSRASPKVDPPPSTSQEHLTVTDSIKGPLIMTGAPPTSSLASSSSSSTSLDGKAHLPTSSSPAHAALLPPMLTPAGDFSLPNLKNSGGSGSHGNLRSLSDKPRLNGSIMEHLTPSPSSFSSSASVSNSTNWSDGLPPAYSTSTTQLVSWGQEGTASTVGMGSGGIVSSRIYTGPIPPATVAGNTKGGVLLKHIPYLPSPSATSVGAGPPVTSVGVGPPPGIGTVENGARDVIAADYAANSVDQQEMDKLKQKVESHAQTIKILVGDKSALQMERDSLKNQLADVSKSSQNWDSQTRQLRVRVEELEKQLLAATSELSGKKEELKHLKSGHSELQLALEKAKVSLEEQQEESTELISKVTSQAAEVARLNSANMELQSKLGMAELLTQQLSGGKPVETTPPDPTLMNRLQESEGQVKQLRLNLELLRREKDQVNSDLAVLQDTMVQQQEESAKELAHCSTELKAAEAKVADLKKKMEDLLVQKEVLEGRLSTEHAQSTRDSQVALEALEKEKEHFKSQLEAQVQENIKLVQAHTELERQALEVELKLSRVQEQSVDSQSLLTAMAQDKETLSRAMVQNKELKRNADELEEKFIKMTHENMELASSLETEKRRVAYLKAQLEATPTTAQKATPTSSPTASSASVATPTFVPTSTPSMALGATPTSEPTATSSSAPDSVATPFSASTTSPSSVLFSTTPESTSLESESVLRGEEEGVVTRIRGVESEESLVEEYQRLLAVAAEQRRKNEDLVAENADLREQLETMLRESSELATSSSRAEATTPPSTEPATPPSAESEVQDPLPPEPVEPSHGKHERPQPLPALAAEETDYPSAMSEDHTPDHTYHDLSAEELTTLQSCFNALKDKFVVLMREKADLLERIQEDELLIARLESETTTIGSANLPSLNSTACNILKPQKDYNHAH